MSLGTIPVSQMRAAAKAWRQHNPSHSMTDRVDDLIDEVERLRSLCDLWVPSFACESGGLVDNVKEQS